MKAVAKRMTTTATMLKMTRSLRMKNMTKARRTPEKKY